MLSAERYASGLAIESERPATAAGRQAPDRVVPTCPEWTVRDLVTNVGSGHRYAIGIIVSAAAELQPFHRVAAPDAQADWGGWLAEGATRLAAAVRERGFDGPVWTWQPRHPTNGFWLRRMVHDLIIRRFDAELIDTEPADAQQTGPQPTEAAVHRL